MSLNVGLERNETDLLKAIDFIQRLEKAGAHDPDMRNMAAACLLIAGAALARQESRGGHFRTDFPATQPGWAHRTFIRLDDVRKRMDERAHADTRTKAKVAERS
jgi:L-aspartate oxidase